MSGAEVILLDPSSPVLGQYWDSSLSLHNNITSPGGRARADTALLLRRFEEAISEAHSTATAGNNLGFETPSAAQRGAPPASPYSALKEEPAPDPAPEPVSPDELQKKFDLAIAEALEDITPLVLAESPPRHTARAVEEERALPALRHADLPELPAEPALAQVPSTDSEQPPVPDETAPATTAFEMSQSHLPIGIAHPVDGITLGDQLDNGAVPYASPLSGAKTTAAASPNAHVGAPADSSLESSRRTTVLSSPNNSEPQTGQVASEEAAQNAGRTESEASEIAPMHATVAQHAGVLINGAGGGSDEEGSGNNMMEQEEAAAREALHQRMSFSKAMTLKTGKAFKSGVKGRSAIGVVVNKESKSWLFCYATTTGITLTAEKARDEALNERDAVHAQRRDDDASYRKKITADCFAFTWKEKFEEPDKCVKMKFKDYASEVFRDLRVLYGVDDNSYLTSINHGGLSEISTAETGSKSGQKFLITSDGRYFMKTITKTEAKFFRSVLAEYYKHMEACRNTLLCRFFGLHRLKHHTWGKLYLIIMSNIFDTDRDIHTRYDLKGSKVGRQVSEFERSQPTTIYKDLDFVEMQHSIVLGSVRRQAVLEQIKVDCDFLKSIGVMDYSLLLGIHQRNIDGTDHESQPPNGGGGGGGGGAPLSHTPSLSPGAAYKDIDGAPGAAGGEGWVIHKNDSVRQRLKVQRTGSLLSLKKEATHVSDLQQDDGGLCSVKLVNGQGVAGDEIYFLGIVDFLQTYSARKFFETNFKSLRYKRNELSAVPPAVYASRFHSFMTQIME